jgi:hypothetical protein
MGRIVLLLSALAWLGFGVVYAVVPELLTDPTGFGSLAPEALTDLRATYGGLQLAIGAFLVWSLARPERHRTGLLLNAVAFGFVAGSRAIGLLIDGELAGGMLLALGIEVTWLAATLLALRWTEHARA